MATAISSADAVPGSADASVPSRTARIASCSARTATLNAWCPLLHSRAPRLARYVRLGERRRGRADDERHAHRSRDRVELGARAQSGQHQAVHPCRFVRAKARDGVLHAGDGRCAGAPEHDEIGVAARGDGGAHLAERFVVREQAWRVGRAVRARQQRVLDHHGRRAGGIQLLHGADHALRVAVAVIGIDDERQRRDACGAMHLLGELGQRQHDDVGGAQHDVRHERSTDEPGFEAKRVREARGHRVEHARHRHAPLAGQDAAQARAGLCVLHQGFLECNDLHKSRALVSAPP